MMKKVKLLNIEVDNITMKEAVINIDEMVKRKKPSYVVTPNVDHVVTLEKDLDFRNVYNEAELVVTDGMPLIWISKLGNTPIKEKISGSDLFPEVCKLAAERKYRIFLLGAGEGVGDIAAENIKKKYPGVEISGVYSPPFGFEKNEEEVEKIIKLLNESNSDILAVGLGAPKQEKFIYQIKNKINIPVSLAIGATIDFEAGNVKRAPKWMQNNGLEWFYRMTTDPKRLAKRYVVDAINIIPLILKYREDR